MGCGRSGTCWAGRILDSHPDVRCTVQHPPIFQTVCRMCARQSHAHEHLPELVQLYQGEYSRTHEPHYADKTHPLLWYWREIDDALATPEHPVWFWWVRREPHQVVASMLQHPPIRARLSDGWSAVDELPSRFLGARSTSDFQRHSVVGRAALRWAAHEAEGRRLCELHPRVVQIDYERLVTHADPVLREVQLRMGLSQPFPPPEVRASRTPPLSVQQKAEVDRVIADFQPWW